MDRKNIAILGSGAWGTSLGYLLYTLKHNVKIWTPFEFERDEVLRTGRNHKLSELKIPPELYPLLDLEEVIKDAEIIVWVVPSQKVRSVAELVSSIVKKTKNKFIAVSCAKGIENNSFKRMSEILFEVLPKENLSGIACLSGPSHAEEVAKGFATSVVSASENIDIANYIRDLFSSKMFRIYSNTDIIGVELGGSIKNVIAIAVGIVDGLGMGDNTKGALVARGLAEIIRLGIKLGAKFSTLAGLSGLGDLITTAFSNFSRNRYVGFQLGLGRKLDDILSSMDQVAEGVWTAKSVFELSNKLNVKMPITEQVNKILFENKSPSDALNELMQRQLKEEFGDFDINI